MSQPNLKKVDDDNYLLLEDYTVHWEKSGTNYRLTIFKGFTCDLASIPSDAWWFKKLTGLWADKRQIKRAALAHDWIYHHSRISKGDATLPTGSHQFLGTDGCWHDVKVSWSRLAADRLFFRLCRQDGLKRDQTVWYAVRGFGWLSWG